jgi:hypothetical protein
MVQCSWSYIFVESFIFDSQTIPKQFSYERNDGLEWTHRPFIRCHINREQQQQKESQVDRNIISTFIQSVKKHVVSFLYLHEESDNKLHD